MSNMSKAEPRAGGAGVEASPTRQPEPQARAPRADEAAGVQAQMRAAGGTPPRAHEGQTSGAPAAGQGSGVQGDARDSDTRGMQGTTGMPGTVIRGKGERYGQADGLQYAQADGRQACDAQAQAQAEAQADDAETGQGRLPFPSARAYGLAICAAASAAAAAGRPLCPSAAAAAPRAAALGLYAEAHHTGLFDHWSNFDRERLDRPIVLAPPGPMPLLARVAVSSALIHMARLHAAQREAADPTQKQPLMQAPNEKLSDLSPAQTETRRGAAAIECGGGPSWPELPPPRWWEGRDLVIDTSNSHTNTYRHRESAREESEREESGAEPLP